MNRYLIERTIPGAGQLSSEELKAISQKSVEVIATMAPRLQWVQSYVTDDAITCVYLADNDDTMREHGQRGGFPVDSVRRVHKVINTMTAEG